MKILALIVSFSFLTIAIGTSDANAARRGTMTGYDNTYGSTGKCQAGSCKPKAKPPAKKMQ
jgi:hypothetical protein